MPHPTPEEERKMLAQYIAQLDLTEVEREADEAMANYDPNGPTSMIFLWN